MNPNLNNNFDSLRLLDDHLFLNEDEFDGLSSNVLDILCQKELSDALKIAGFYYIMPSVAQMMSVVNI